MAVAHFPSGSVLTCATFFETANAGDVMASSVAATTQVASTPLLNDASHRLLEFGDQATPHEREMTRAYRVASRALRAPRGSPRSARRAASARSRPSRRSRAAPWPASRMARDRAIGGI